MKQTQEQIDLITEWFNTTWWPLYPSDLSHGKKGPKTVALKAMLKLNPSEDMMQDILNKMRVLIRAAKTEKRCGKEPDRWPFASTFINQERWSAIEDMKMPSTITDKRKCSVDGCNNDVGWKTICWKHYDELHADKCLVTKTDLRDNFIAEGLFHDESKTERTKRCREFTVPRLRHLLEASRQANGLGKV